MAHYRVHLQEDGEEYPVEVEANGTESAKKRARVGRPYSEVARVEDLGSGEVNESTVEPASQRTQSAGTQGDRLPVHPPAVSGTLTAAGWAIIAMAAIAALYVASEFNAGLYAIQLVAGGVVSGSILIAGAQGLTYLKAIHFQLEKSNGN
ncbi:hypothetical protein [Salicola sp. Rm-C-2C1-2]|uniref:hypothetical protein n=1 Tax=Salicola sp. Rm-C-2C1-2 TaxID=3141321 RepID=UPI0032E51095